MNKRNSGVAEGTMHLEQRLMKSLAGGRILAKAVTGFWGMTEGPDSHLRLLLLWLSSVESRPRENVSMENSKAGFE